MTADDSKGDWVLREIRGALPELVALLMRCMVIRPITHCDSQGTPGDSLVYL